ncbi:MAG: CocE/NonD family hydrolase C-terminal non-catalytic domain-containing protein [Nocardioides sp.]
MARLRVTADRLLASLSVKLCDVFLDGTSALVSRGPSTWPTATVRPGRRSRWCPVRRTWSTWLDACAYAWSPGQTLRLSVAGADWPNTVAPPGPVTLTVEGTVEPPPPGGQRLARAGVHPGGGALHRVRRGRDVGGP